MFYKYFAPCFLFVVYDDLFCVATTVNKDDYIKVVN